MPTMMEDTMVFGLWVMDSVSCLVPWKRLHVLPG